jgi:hypothetical protein
MDMVIRMIMGTAILHPMVPGHPTSSIPHPNLSLRPLRWPSSVFLHLPGTELNPQSLSTGIRLPLVHPLCRWPMTSRMSKLGPRHLLAGIAAARLVRH